jgi:hypothetical protein
MQNKTGVVNFYGSRKLNRELLVNEWEMTDNTPKQKKM